MDAPVSILVVCTHEGIMATILRLIAKNPVWQAIGAADEQTATQMIAAANYDLVLLGSGLTQAQEHELAQLCAAKTTAPKLIQHFGGGSGLLFAEIYQALAGK